MLYSVLIYDSEVMLEKMTDEEHESRLGQHLEFQDSLRESHRLGAVVRLKKSASAVTLQSGSNAGLILDGPFAETKEQLIGFYLVEGESLEAVAEVARKLPLQSGSIEIRPIDFFEGANFKEGLPIVFKDA